MSQLDDRVIRYLTAMARAFEPQIETVTDPNSEHSLYDQDRYASPALTYLALYRENHPENPYAGDPAALDLYQKLIGGWVKKWEDSGGAYRFVEWPIYIMGCGLDLERDELDGGLAERVSRLIAWWVEQDLRRPFFFTAPNHEIWKLAGAALAGRLLDRPEWRRQAGFEAEQMLAWQTDEGFWEEGRHHGPSLKYNYVMLSALAILARELENDRLVEAARRLAGFIARWVFPDGVTVGAFDGRRPTLPTAACPGLELAPEGLDLMNRALAFWERNGWLDPEAADGPIQRGAAQHDWIASAWLIYRAQWLADQTADTSSPQAELPAARPGAALENHTPKFDAALRRQGPWCVGLSGQLSDVPKIAPLFIFRLERQNRIELWHERASVVVGGGHNLLPDEHPLYNVWVDPGYRAEPDEYSGKTESGPGSPAMARRRSLYYPRAAASGIDGAASWLELVFAHATVRFEIEPDPQGLAVRYEYRAEGVEELRVALPLVVWEGGRVLTDNNPVGPEAELVEFPVARQVEVDQPLFGARTTLTVPAAGATRITFPIRSIQSYTTQATEKEPPGIFAIAFVETVLDVPGRSGAGEWKLVVN